MEISLAELAAAAGVESVRIKNWLDRRERNQVTLDGATPEPGPGRRGRNRRFSRLDVLRVAMIGRLMRYGLNAETASALTEKFLGFYDRKQRRYISDPNTTAEDAAQLFAQQLLAVWHDEVAGTYTIKAILRADIERFKALDDLFDRSSEAFLILNIGAMASQVFGRLTE